MDYHKEIEDLKKNISENKLRLINLEKIITGKDEKLSDLISTLNQILIELNKPKRSLTQWLKNIIF